MDTQQIRVRLEQLSSEEIENRIYEGYYAVEELNIAKQIVSRRKQETEANLFLSRDKIVNKAMIAAWISAIAAIVSAICTVINLLK